MVDKKKINKPEQQPGQGHSFRSPVSERERGSGTARSQAAVARKPPAMARGGDVAEIVAECGQAMWPVQGWKLGLLAWEYGGGSGKKKLKVKGGTFTIRVREDAVV